MALSFDWHEKVFLRNPTLFFSRSSVHFLPPPFFHGNKNGKPAFVRPFLFSPSTPACLFLREGRTDGYNTFRRIDGRTWRTVGLRQSLGVLGKLPSISSFDSKEYNRRSGVTGEKILLRSQKVCVVYLRLKQKNFLYCHCTSVLFSNFCVCSGA